MSGHNDGFAFDKRHASCTSWTFMSGQGVYDPVHEAEASHRPMLCLSLLGACRQAYEEANLLLWKTNTFSFEDATTLSTFVNSLHSTQRKKLARMHIDFGFPGFSEMKSQNTLGLSLGSRLTGLRTLHATIRQPSQSSVRQRIRPFLEQMQVLPLQDVTIVVENPPTSFQSSLGTTGLVVQFEAIRTVEWPIAERQGLAEYIRGNLLDSNGPEEPSGGNEEEQGLGRYSLSPRSVREVLRHLLHAFKHGDYTFHLV